MRGKRGHALVVESAKAQAAAERGALALERELREREAELSVVRAQLDAATAWSASDLSVLMAAAEGLAARTPSSLVALGVDEGAAALVARASTGVSSLPLPLQHAAAQRAAHAIEGGATSALRASVAIEAQLAKLVERAAAAAGGAVTAPLPPATAVAALRMKKQRNLAKRQTIRFARAMIASRQRCVTQLRRCALFRRWCERTRRGRPRAAAGAANPFAHLWDTSVDPGAETDARPFAAAARELHARYATRAAELAARAAEVAAMHDAFAQQKAGEVRTLRAALALQQRRAAGFRNKCFELEIAAQSAALASDSVVAPEPPAQRGAALSAQHVEYIARRGITRCLRRTKERRLRAGFAALRRRAAAAAHSAKLASASRGLGTWRTKFLRLPLHLVRILLTI